MSNLFKNHTYLVENIINKFPKFSRPIYLFAKDHFSYESSFQVKLLYFFDWVVSIISSIHFLFIAYLMSVKFSTVYNFQKYDPIARFYWNLSSQFDSFFPVLVVIFSIFELACETVLMFINRETLIVSWLNDLIVQYQNHYYKCMLDPMVVLLTQKRKEWLIQKELSKYKVTKFLWPKFLLKLCCKVKAKLYIFNNLDHLNKKKFCNYSFPIFPGFSNKNKLKVIKIMITADLIGKYFQLFYGEYTFHYISKQSQNFCFLGFSFYWNSIINCIFKKNSK